MDHKTATLLYRDAGAESMRLPPWEDVGVLPGVGEGDVKALAELAGTLPR